MRGISRILLISALAVVSLLGVLPGDSAEAKPWIGVRGNQLVDRGGDPLRLLGVNRSGAEYQCVKAGEVFDGPTDRAAIEAMKTWQINAVRVPLNESCWLGLEGVPEGLGGGAYRRAIRGYVQRLEAAGLYVILDLHWAAPGNNLATGLIPMPDADHGLEFWRSLATAYRGDRSVVFDLFNEPRPGVSWECWEHGCEVEDQYYGRYPVVGMRSLVETVRGTGAKQPLMLGGLNWSSDLRGWLAHVPTDPAHALVASNHTYDSLPCDKICKSAIDRVHRKYPVVTGELGEGDCRHGYIDAYMRWADRHDISYLGWTWDAGNGWTCADGPSLIKNYVGSPTAFGAGFRHHLRQLSRAGTRSRTPSLSR